MPPSGKYFVGRRRELRELLQFFRSGKPGVLVITGLGGVGKTALVQRFITRLTSRDDTGLDGLFFWSFYQNPDPNDFFEHLNNYFHNPINAADDTIDLSGISSSLKTAGRFVLVLDGFEQVQQTVDSDFGALKAPKFESFISTLESGIGTVQCLITTRHPLKLSAIDDHRELVLDELSGAEALKLLYFSGLNLPAKALSELIQQYGKHPLTLQILGAYLANEKETDFSLKRLLSFDTNRDTNRNSLLNILQVSLDRLNPEQKEILEIISTYPEGIKIVSLKDVLLYLHHKGGLSEISYTDENCVNRLIQELSQYSFVMITKDGFCTIHPIIRNYVQSISDQIQSGDKVGEFESDNRAGRKELFETIFSVIATGNIGQDEIAKLIDHLNNDESEEAFALQRLLEAASTIHKVSIQDDQTEQDRPQVFISYVRDDSDSVAQLRAGLEKNQIDVWQDKDRLFPGVRWKQEIREAIKNGDFFIACFSEKYWSRKKTYMNEELALAIEELRLRPSERLWFIPVLLGPCEIPNRPIGAGETLYDIQHVELYKEWEQGVEKIVRSIFNSI